MSAALLNNFELASVLSSVYQQTTQVNAPNPIVDRKALQDVRVLLKIQPDRAEDVEREFIAEMQYQHSLSGAPLRQALHWFRFVSRQSQGA